MNTKKTKKPQRRGSKRTGKFKSSLEHDVFRKLPKGTQYETEKLPYVVFKNYIPDFIILTPTGKIYLEVKGWFRPEDITKMLAVKKQNPDLDIRFYFPSNNKLNAGSETRYSDWSERHGFPYYIGTLPKTW